MPMLFGSSGDDCGSTRSENASASDELGIDSRAGKDEHDFDIADGRCFTVSVFLEDILFKSSLVDVVAAFPL